MLAALAAIQPAGSVADEVMLAALRLAEHDRAQKFLNGARVQAVLANVRAVAAVATIA